MSSREAKMLKKSIAPARLEGGVASVPGSTEEPWLWHARFGHLSFDALGRLEKMVLGLHHIKHADELCDSCLAKKQRRLSFPKAAKYHTADTLELVHGNLCGPITPATNSGWWYFLLLIDDCSCYMWLQLLTRKDKAAEAIKKFKAHVEAESGKKLCVLRTDRGSEFTLMEFAACISHIRKMKLVLTKLEDRSTPMGTLSMTIEFASPPSDITEFMDAFHDGEEVRFHKLDNIIGGTGSSGLAGQLLNDPELHLIDVEEPPMFVLAKHDANCRWAMLEEMKAIKENETWEFIDPPLGYCPIGLKWVYNVKQDKHGTIVKHKARLVA
ncbi:uncharacterized protein [Miscanthus floridulus]|uniref:uncharacterized protein n=1 Tax=Miscanthus floridulus TaxID=154761 RepID=UPI003457A645